MMLQGKKASAGNNAPAFASHEGTLSQYQNFVKTVYSSIVQATSSANFAYSFLAGGVAGAVSRTVVSPFERLKIIFQVQLKDQKLGEKHYNGVGSALKLIYKEEGMIGYLRGNGVNCLRIMPYSAIQFASYHVYKSCFINSKTSELGTQNRLVAGALAGITSVVTTYPLDITRTRLSIQSAHISSRKLVDEKHIPGLFQVAKSIYKNEGGIVGLYRGLIPTVIGVAPYVGLNFAVYEGVRSRIAASGRKPTQIDTLMCGAVAGAVAQTITYPMDVLRRRFQVNTMVGVDFQYRSIYHALRTIIKQEGVRALYLGLGPNLLKVIPSMGTSWLTFEFTKDLLIKHFEKEKHQL